MERKSRGAGQSSLARLEDQIAAVAGRKRAAPSGTLEKLEDGLLGHPRGSAVVTAQSYDAGAPIALRYRQAHYTLVPEMSAPPAWAGEQAFADAVPYTVEPFDQPSAGPESAPLACYPAPAEPAPSSPNQEAPLPVAPEPRSGALLPAFSAEADDFGADIRAILAQGGVAEAQGTEPPVESQPTEPPPVTAPVEDAHDIFDQMGQNLQYANTFDLGAIDLGPRFDAFERDLDREASAAPAKPVAALKPPAELDDLDVLADLVQIGEKVPVKKPDGEAGAGAVVTDGADQEGQAVPAKKPDGEAGAGAVVTDGADQEGQAVPASDAPAPETGADQPEENTPASARPAAPDAQPSLRENANAPDSGQNSDAPTPIENEPRVGGG
jgi:hypothetical protein